MGPWGDGFDDGFGPLVASGVLSVALLSLLGFMHKKEEHIMEQVIVTGVNASGMIKIDPTQYAYIKSVEIDLPLDEVGTTDPQITLSGSVTGAKTFHSDTTLDLRFQPNEDVYITTSNFTAEYSSVIRYVIGGANKEVYNNTDTTRRQARFVPNFWRYR